MYQDVSVLFLRESLSILSCSGYLFMRCYGNG